MTREEAIKVLEMFLHKQCDLERTKFAYNANTVWEAVNMAIKALGQEPCEDAVSRTEVKKIAKEMYLEVANMKLDVTTISDCISYTSSKCREVLERKLQTLPSVTPVSCIAKITYNKDDLQKLVDEKVKEITVERKSGHWIKEYDNSTLDGLYHCSVCGRKLWIHNEESVSDYPYCHCGAEMRGVE